MTLPTFLGIGVPRGGSTWLHALLASHPEVFMPTRRKEVRFFDREFDRGREWYEEFFPSDDLATQYRAIGEISPQYYQHEECPKRIYQMLPDSRLLIILRHPIDRAYSVYGFHVQRRNFQGSFSDFLEERPEVLTEGLYSQYLKRYLEYFDRSRILTLVFEEAVSNTAATKKRIAEFLQVDPAKFPSSAGDKKVNASSIPKHRSLYSLAVRIGHQFQRWRMDKVVDLARRSNFELLLAKGDALPRLNRSLRQQLSLTYSDDFHVLESDLGLDLRSWQSSD